MPRFDFGPLDLLGVDPAGDEFWFETLADGWSLGSPEAVKVLSDSRMRDGDDSRIDRYGNRTIPFTVKVCGTDPVALAAGEEALAAQVGGRNTISWEPPDDFGLTTVFDVLNSTMQFQPNDLAEICAGIKKRAYSLELECLPFGRSVDLTTVTFEPSTVAPTVLDDATSPAAFGADWTAASYGGNPAVRYRYDYTDPGGYATVIMTWAGSVPADPYVAVDLNGAGDPISVTLDDGVTGPFATEDMGPGTRCWFVNPNPGGSSLTFRVTLGPFIGYGGFDLYAFGVLASTGTGATATLSALVGGSARTTGAVTLARATDMTYAFIYSDPAMGTHGFNPASPTTWQFAPEGTYAVFIDDAGLGVALAVGDVIKVEFTNQAGSTQVVSTRVHGFPDAFRGVGEAHLGGLQSGLVGVQAVVVKVNDIIQTTPEMRLFRKDRETATALTFLSGLAGANEIVLETPSLASRGGGLWADGVTALDKASSWEFPLLDPGSCSLYVEANDSGTDPVSTTLDFYRRWHTFAGA